MKDLLAKATEKENAFYMTLSNPQFKGQTRPDSNNIYWMVFENNGNLYKFKHKL